MSDQSILQQMLAGSCNNMFLSLYPTSITFTNISTTSTADTTVLSTTLQLSNDINYTSSRQKQLKMLMGFFYRCILQ